MGMPTLAMSSAFVVVLKGILPVVVGHRFDDCDSL